MLDVPWENGPNVFRSLFLRVVCLGRFLRISARNPSRFKRGGLCSSLACAQFVGLHARAAGGEVWLLDGCPEGSDPGGVESERL